MKNKILRIPRMFYEDHEARDLPTPPAVRSTARHVWIDHDHEDVPELLSDARYYSDPTGFDRECRGLCASARATVKAIDEIPTTHSACRVGIVDDDEDHQGDTTMNTTTKRVRLTLTDPTRAPDQQKPREYLVEMPVDYDPALVTYEDVMLDGRVGIVDDDEDR